MQSTTASALPAYEAILHQYLDGRPILPSIAKSSTAERDRAFFCHPLWETAPREAFAHELFAVAYARYFRQQAVSNTLLLHRVATLAPEALMRAARYAQLFLNLESPRWQEMRQLATEGNNDLHDFIALQEIINAEYRRLWHEVQRAEEAASALSVVEFLLFASLHGFRSLLPERIRIEQLREAAGDRAPDQVAHISVEAATYDRAYVLTTDAIWAILTWKLRSRPAHELELDEAALTAMLAGHLRPLLSPARPLPRQHRTRLDAVAGLIQAHVDLRDFLDRSADAYSFRTDFNFVLSPCRRYALRDPGTSETSAWELDGQKAELFQTYWLARTARHLADHGLVTTTVGTTENHERNLLALLKTYQSRLRLAEVYGIPDAVVPERGARVDTFQALLSGHLTAAFFQAAYIEPFGEHLRATGNWREAVGRLALGGLASGENRLPLTWAARSEKARSLIRWTTSERYPEGDLATSEATLAFWTLDLRGWAAKLRADPRAELPALYERPYLQIGECLIQIPWLSAAHHTANATVNQLRLRGHHRPGLRDETRAIEERLGQALRARGFQVVLSYQPPRADGADDPGEVDVIGQRNGHLFIIEVKSTYVRSTVREVWQHQYQTLRRAGRQVERKCAAVAEALRYDPGLGRRLGLPQGEMPTATHGWIVDTSIEHDHTRFSGHLKVSLEELLVVLRDERHLLLGLTEAAQKITLYPDGFSAGRFAAIVEGNELWSMLGPT